jgi:PKD repeat protein
MKKLFTSALFFMLAVSAFAQIPPTAVFNAPATSICSGTTVAYIDQSFDSILTWMWIFEGGVPDTSFQQNPVIVYPNSGVFDVTLIVTNANGSDTAYADDFITVNETPTVSLGSDMLICAGDTITITATGSGLGGDSVTTTYVSNNGQRGNMFDITAVNDIIIQSFDIHLDATTMFAIFYKVGSYVGSETNPANWTLVDSVIVTANGQGAVTPCPIPVNITIPAGQTYGWYLTSTSPTISVNYTNGTAVGNIYAQNADLQILEGVGKDWPFGATFTPRVWNGTVYYSPAHPVSFSWNTGDTTKSITVAPADTSTYIVIVADSNGCSDSDTIVVNTLDIPVPVITPVGSQLQTQTGFSSYQWYLNGNIIFGANSNVYTPVQNGTYTVVVTNAANCSGTSAPFLFVGENELTSEWNFSVLYNPDNQSLTINLPFEFIKSLMAEKTELKIFDVTGREVFQSPVFSIQSSINVSKFESGSYFVQLSNAESEKVVKFMKE